MTNNESKEDLAKKERRIKQLAKLFVFAKASTSQKFLKGLEGSSTVAEVNNKTGCGSGGCQGERCGPRIKALRKEK